MKEIKQRIKQLFCRHEFKKYKDSGFLFESAEFHKCKKCGLLMEVEKWQFNYRFAFMPMNAEYYRNYIPKGMS